MRPSNVLAAKASPEHGTIVIARIAPHSGWIHFLGVSAQASMLPGEYCDSLSIAVPKGTTELVALHVYEDNGRKYGGCLHYDFLLEVTNEENRGAVVNLEHEWLPSSDRLGCASSDGVKVTIDDRLYIGHEYPKYGSEPSGWYVDGNLLCKYLVGKATAEQVKAAAKEFRKDEPFLTQKEQKELQAEVMQLKRELAVEHAARVAAEQFLRSANQSCETAHQKLNVCKRECRELGEIADLFFRGTHWHWFKSDALKSALRMYATFLKDKDSILATK